MKLYKKPRIGQIGVCNHGSIRIEQSGLYEITRDFVTVIEGMHNNVISKKLVSKGYQFQFMNMTGFGEWVGVLPYFHAPNYFERVSDCVSRNPHDPIDDNNKSIFILDIKSNYET